MAVNKQIKSSNRNPLLKQGEWAFALTGGNLGRLFHRFSGKVHIWTADRPPPKRLSYGHMWTNTEVVITIGDNNPTEVDSGITTGIVFGMTFAGSHNLTISHDGVYSIVWNMSIETAAAGAKVEAEGGIMINGAAQDEGQQHRTIDNTQDTGAYGSNAILALSAGDEISLFVQNETNTTDIHVEHLNLSIDEKGWHYYGQNH